eukprot:CAMPEP_0198128802 /NCGR_PEP_ID=MMETSP1442-20131203/50259_1 /TAXON_ID= /ORGANISM="Craspedostauros australis, Strain CCMP3328" /LENGTH=363 /DNA_ID=CAMNT_0043789045 /DNA_START=48 /DNA_END=1139 /DNA_ORIENTATION=-
MPALYQHSASSHDENLAVSGGVDFLAHRLKLKSITGSTSAEHSSAHAVASSQRSTGSGCPKQPHIKSALSSSCDYAETGSSHTARSSLHVSFSSHLHIREIPSMDEYTGEERYQMFYDREDFLDFQQEVRETVDVLLFPDDRSKDCSSCSSHRSSSSHEDDHDDYDNEYDYENESSLSSHDVHSGFPKQRENYDIHDEDEDCYSSSSSCDHDADDADDFHIEEREDEKEMHCLRGCELGIPSFVDHRERIVEDAWDAIRKEHDKQEEEQFSRQPRCAYEDEDEGDDHHIFHYDLNRFRAVYQWFSVPSLAKAHRQGLQDEKDARAIRLEDERSLHSSFSSYSDNSTTSLWFNESSHSCFLGPE